MSCSTKIIGMPAWARTLAISCAISALSSEFIPATGSSSNISLGSIASARANSTRFWMPYGSVRMGSSR
jgi:hypothetical protein